MEQNGVSAQNLAPIVVYNPMTFIHYDRQKQILDKFRNCSMILLAGTKLQAEKGNAIKIIQSHKGWIILSCGYPQRCGNRSAGVAICINLRFIRLKHIRRMGFPKAHLQGRALFLRICVGKLDLTVGCIYVPPQSITGAVSMVTEQIYDYMDTIMKHTPSRSWPIIGGQWKDKQREEWKID